MTDLVINLKEFSPVPDLSEQLGELLSVEEFISLTEEKVNEYENESVFLLNPNGRNDGRISLFSRFDNAWWAGKYVGTVSYPYQDEHNQDYRITVNFTSRFDDSDSAVFLSYIFEKALDIPDKWFPDMQVQGVKDKTFDFLLVLLFFRRLHDAMKKGIFRSYKDFEHNDSAVRGRIDVARHIKENLQQGNGKICYSTREYTAQNDLNRLILMAAQCLQNRHRALFSGLLKKDDVCDSGLKLLQNTFADVPPVSAGSVIKACRRRIAQSVYRAYEPLRQAAILVLRRCGISTFVQSSVRASGLLIDMPALWERFLYQEIFRHVLKTSAPYQQKGFPILGERRTLFPDFYLPEHSLVVDAKYKPRWGEAYKDVNWEKTREDVFQIITYQHCLCTKNCGAIFPLMSQGDKPAKKLPLAQNLADEYFWLFPVAVNTADPENFRQNMERQSKKLISAINGINLTQK